MKGRISSCGRDTHHMLSLLARVALIGLVFSVIALQAQDHAKGLEILREGRVDEALAIFRDSVENRPDDVEALNMVGAILCLKDDPRSSIPYFERALALAPEFVAARKNLAMAEFESGLYESAGANLRKLLDVPEAQAQASLFLGMIDSQLGRHEEAVERLDGLGALLQTQPRAQLALARSLQHVGEVESARQLLEKLRAQPGLSGPDLVDAAQIAAIAGRFDNAMEDLERAESLDASLEGLGVRRVEVLTLSGRQDEALELARQLASRTPTREIKSLVAGLSEESGDLDAAVMALREAIQADPKSEEGYIELAEFCVKYSNPKLALEILDLGLGQLPSSYRLLVQKGITLGRGQRYDQAQQALSLALELTPDHSVALTALAVSLFMSGEVEEALAKLARGVVRFPEDFYMHYIYGFVLDRSRLDGSSEGGIELAELHLRRALRLNKDFAPAYFRLGKLLSEADPEEAMRNLEAAVRLDPTLVSAKYQLGQLYIETGDREAGARLLREVGEDKQRNLEKEQMPGFRAVRTE
ncbi:MAG: tetratricopeptide repeat protein [Acidobacteriia bacterium]|nr:tetratricopeptide repeat protein [Terriglobia bacterium]MYG01144.1 tetratricopeptide repeat protein [Terriglobia bacterium]MYK10594.1 tetratricopeptide repeat protein [Terriglobia bacterium]